LLFTDDYALLPFSEQRLQHALDRFSAACNQAGMKTGTITTEVLRLSRNPRQCTLQVRSNALQQSEKFMYLGVVFTNDGRQNKEVDTRIGRASTVLREPHHSVSTKREVSNTGKL